MPGPSGPSGRRLATRSIATAVSRKVVQPYATMPKGVMGNEGSWSLVEVLSVSAT